MNTPVKIALIVGFVFLAGCLSFVSWLHYWNSNAVYTYSWRIEYGKMPPGDATLVDWLKSQPGLIDASAKREGKVLVVSYDMKIGEPLPKLLEKADTLGYAERGSFFADMQQK